MSFLRVNSAILFKMLNTRRVSEMRPAMIFDKIRITCIKCRIYFPDKIIRNFVEKSELN